MNRARRRKTGPKYRVLCRFIWRQISPVSLHLHPAGGLCRIYLSCNQKCALGGSAATVSSWCTIIPAAAQASRAWWTLRWAGLADVRVLDGGYGAWTAASRPSSNHNATRAVCGGDVILTPGCMPTVDAEEAAYLAKQSKLLDARPWAAYVGDPDKGGTGHIPGAIHAPSSDNIADGKFKPNKCRPRLEASKKICRACRRGVRMVAHRPVMRKVADNGQIVRCSTEATITPMSAFVCALRSVAVWPHLVAC